RGDGLAFLSASGTLVERELAAGEVLRVDTGCLVAMQPSVGYDIEMVRGVKTMLFGGEGLFYVKLTGPVKIVLQTMPFSRLAEQVIAHAPALQRQGTSRGLIGGILGDQG
ncbi:MAG: AIM24 family protein, partial [Gemmatimonadota bacterium]